MRMTRRKLIGALTGLLLIQGALAFAESRVIYEIVAANELVDVDLEIPSTVKPGYHQMLVEVLDDNGLVRSKIALFCKDIDGTVNLDNDCPGLAAAGFEKVKVAGQEKVIKYGEPFSPKDNPTQTQGLLVTLFALATTLFSTQKRENDENSMENEESSDEKGNLETVNAGALAIRESVIGFGDQRRERRGKSDSWIGLGPDLARRANSLSFILARIVLDARYLRAIFGSRTWLLTLLGAFCAWRGVNEIGREAIPLTFGWLVVIMAIAIFDAFAGFYASLAYLLCILFEGNLDSFSSVVTVFGTMLIMYAPALIASTFRPMQRTVVGAKNFWERITDYAVGILLAAMAVKGLVTALSGLSGIKLQISDRSGDFALIAAFALLIRFLLEERAWYSFPRALREQTIEISNIRGLRAFFKSFVRFFLFVVFSLPFVGPTKGFLLGVAIYLVGQIISKLEINLPKSRILGQLLPSGVPNIITVSIVGGFVSYGLSRIVTDAGHLIESTFWVMALPGLVFAVLGKAKGEPYFKFKARKELTFSYVVLGIFAYFLLVCTILGVDLSQEIRDFF